MGRKEKVSAERKFNAVQEYLSNSKRPTQICNEL